MKLLIVYSDNKGDLVIKDYNSLEERKKIPEFDILESFNIRCIISIMKVFSLNKDLHYNCSVHLDWCIKRNIERFGKDIFVI